MRPGTLESMSTEPPPPSQVNHPWRAILRTGITALIALIPIFPQIADAADIDEIPAVAQFLATLVVVQRVITLPSVENWLRRFVPWLAAESYDYEGKHREKANNEN